MRQGQQNRRRSGRGRNRSSNPLSKNYESNGPDVKIKGTAAHIAEKYQALARDFLSSGNPVTAESYLQHAEHYNRIIMAAQAKQEEQTASRSRPPEPVQKGGNGGPDEASEEKGAAENIPGIGAQPVINGNEAEAGASGEAKSKRKPRARKAKPAKTDTTDTADAGGEGSSATA